MMDCVKQREINNNHSNNNNNNNTNSSKMIYLKA